MCCCLKVTRNNTSTSFTRITMNTRSLTIGVCLEWASAMRSISVASRPRLALSGMIRPREPIPQHQAPRAYPFSSCPNLWITKRDLRREKKRVALLKLDEGLNVSELLLKPSWSVRSLLPEADAEPPKYITEQQLKHLHRLSALSHPKEYEISVNKSLERQLHFVRNIQSVDTSGVEPLQSIRDETHQAMQERVVGLKQLRGALQQEKTFGHRKRPKKLERKNNETNHREEWNIPSTASQKTGNYFLVRPGKQQRPLP